MNDVINFDWETTAILIFNGKEWVDKAPEIRLIYKAYYYGSFSGYNIYYHNRNKKYFYKRFDVTFYKLLEHIDINKKDVYVNGEIVNATKVDLFENKYYRIYVDGKTYMSKNVRFASAIYRDIYEYYIRLAYYALKVTREDEPLHILAKNYRFLNRNRNTGLFDFFNGKVTLTLDKNIILVPFDYNQSQYTAIEEALNHNISVIEGPPGTGKTQTILNLIGNILYRGKTCAVVSNNNTAIDNVCEKLNEEKIGFVAARLGGSNNVANFFDFLLKDDFEMFLAREDLEVFPNYPAKVKDYSIRIKRIRKLEVESALLQDSLRELRIEQKNHDLVNNLEVKFREFLKPKYYLKLLNRLKKPKKLIFIEKWLIKLIFNIKVDSKGLDQTIDAIEKAFYEVKILEIENKLRLNEEIIKEKNTIYKQLKDISYILFLNGLKRHYIKNNVKNFTKSNYKNDYNNFLLRFPVILSTTYSLLNNAPNGFLFDYLIIDEASQCDMFSSVLAMSCAKNLVIIGDSRQLQQIDEDRLFKESQRLAERLDVPKSYLYDYNCVLKAVKESIKDIPTTLLREHYRCSPDIIGFCNKMFYDNELVIMTQNSCQHLEVIKTVPGNHARKNPNGPGLYNLREIDEIKEVIKLSDSGDIGIITPFRYQADLISKECQDFHIEVDTVHKFQGRQKEEVILSFVVNSLDKNPENIENRLYDFITNEKLLNVAISRGKKKVTAIVSDGVYNSKSNVISDFIKYIEYIYSGSTSKESKIKSVFDCLYSAYTDELKELIKKKQSYYITENIMCNLLDEILKNHRTIKYSMHVRLNKIVQTPSTYTEEEKRYINHPWTHVDFLFYNKISKEPLFVIEVDGVRFHEQSEKQVINDEIKDRVLTSNNIGIYRFKTNESREKERLESIIQKYTY